MTMTDLRRAEYRDLHRYTDDTGPCAIDLSDNTNLWGAPPSVAALCVDAAVGRLRGYPEPYSESLKACIARYVNVTPAQVATGAGSDDILDCAFRALAPTGATVAYIAPTFVMVPAFARTNGLLPAPIPMTAAFDADVDALIATRAQIIYLCSPNNPTGGGLSRVAIEEVLERAPGYVLVDEAYVDFAGTTVADLLERFPRLVIARTFSKAFGLAGLRVGYALASPDVVIELEKARGPYKVGALSALAAQSAIEKDLTWVRDRAALAIAGRENLRTALATLGIATRSSAANFVFAPVREAAAIADAMRARGIALRAFSNIPQIDARLIKSRGAALRITVGPADVMSTALDALADVLTSARRAEAT